MKRNQRTILWRKLVGVSLLALSAAGLVYAGAVYGGRIIAFISDGMQFRAWVKAQGIWGRFAMMGIMAVQIILAFLPGEPVEIAAGFAFGPVEGGCAVSCRRGGGLCRCVFSGPAFGNEGSNAVHYQGKVSIDFLYAEHQMPASSDFCFIFYTWFS